MKRNKFYSTEKFLENNCKKIIISFEEKLHLPQIKNFKLQMELAIKKNLKNRMIPLTEFMLQAAFIQKVELSVIRDRLREKLVISTGRMSQLENAIKGDALRYSKEQIDIINKFFTEQIGEKINIEDSSPICEGLFSAEGSIILAK